LATLVTFHAHPDDEAIATGGVMAKAAAEGHRVVLVVATRGELGEVVEGVLNPGEELGARREIETEAAAAILGVTRVEFLGYVDSGMPGTPSNSAPGSFWTADVEEAAARLAAILREEQADVLTAYDERGVYGHPDHVQVHRVGLRAAEMAGTPRVYLNTVDADALEALVTRLAEADPALLESLSDPAGLELGVPGERVTTRVDVRSYLGPKRRAMAAHASQIPPSSFFLALTPEHFEAFFGEECFIRVGSAPGVRETDLFDGLV
jgi:LmbE family N-acetylglucosaminyl deacetylase